MILTMLADLLYELRCRILGYPVAPDPQYPLPWCEDEDGWCGIAQVCRFNCWDFD